MIANRLSTINFRSATFISRYENANFLGLNTEYYLPLATF
jgi:hypothetical protein